MRRGWRGVAAAIVTGMVVGTSGGALAGSPAGAVSTDQSYWVPVGKQITVTGRGYGHGHGMSQHGAQGAALQGLGYQDIVGFYYPGTSWGKVRGRVRVLISARGPITLWTPSGSRTYRGILRAASPAPGSSSRDTVNIVTIDQYVMGVVPYEMPASWHPEAVKSQAVAARTYATWSRNQNFRRHYQICDTTACQVYGGVDGEDRRSNAAVRATRREVLTYDGKPAFTQFSASSGGWTSRGSVPYLPAQPDPYDGWEGNSNHRWTTTVDAARLESAHPSIGRLTRIWVTERDGNGDWQGRVVELVLDGTDGNVTISGDSFRWAFGLRSSWFTIEPTPIMTRWERIGGTDSRLGAVRSAEYPVASGAAQSFEGGRIFHSPRTGARELYGRILRRYVRIGGPSSELGFPRTKVRRRGPNRLARFENGSMYFTPPSVPRAVTDPIDRAYRAEGWIRVLGWPTSSTYDVRGGERVDFERGSIVWNRRTGDTTVHH